ncbi:MAG: CapA family protein [Lachnospiraceae bacterium]|nr:CapA family protein [Lachnospiraceae bacterium]
MNCLTFFGDVHWEDGKYFLESTYPFVFNLEYAVETERVIPAINKIIVTGNGNFRKWKKKPFAVNLANNHILDLGDEGFLHTMSVLKRQGILYFGAGKASDHYNNPCFVRIREKNVAFLGYSDYKFLLEKSSGKYDCAAPSKEQIAEDMRICKRGQADVIIVNVHWGREERSWHNKRQEKIGHWLIDSGADLVIGHHPHCIQPVELYRGKYIFYSLGNSYFPNLCTPSYYDREGKSEFVASVRNLRCGRESLKVTYNLENKKVIEIQRLEYRRGKVVEKEKIKNFRTVNRIYKNPWINEISGYWRRILILIKSNVLVDGKLFNRKAFRKEFEFIYAKKKK